MKRQNGHENDLGHADQGDSRYDDIVDGKMPTDPCFVLEINRRGILAFSAATSILAQEWVRERWLVGELTQFRSGGRPILGPTDECTVRPARPRESIEIQINRWLDQEQGEDSKFGFAFLIPIDAQLN